MLVCRKATPNKRIYNGYRGYFCGYNKKNVDIYNENITWI
jgi:hypothetical protein